MGRHFEGLIVVNAGQVIGKDKNRIFLLATQGNHTNSMIHKAMLQLFTPNNMNIVQL